MKATSVPWLRCVIEVPKHNSVSVMAKVSQSIHLCIPGKRVARMEVGIDDSELVVGMFVCEGVRKNVSFVNHPTTNFIVIGDRLWIDGHHPSTAGGVRGDLKDMVRKSGPKAANKLVRRESDVL